MVTLLVLRSKAHAIIFHKLKLPHKTLLLSFLKCISNLSSKTLFTLCSPKLPELSSNKTVPILSVKIFLKKEFSFQEKRTSFILP